METKHSSHTQRVRAFVFGLNLLYRATSFAFAGLVAMRLVLALLPPIQAWLSKRIVDSLSNPTANGLDAILWIAVIFAGMQILDSLMNPISQIMTGSVSDRTIGFLNGMIMERASRIQTLEPFETPALNDELNTVCTLAKSVSKDFAASTLIVIEQAISTVAFLLLGWHVNHMIPIVLGVSMLVPAFDAERARKARYRLNSTLAEPRRRFDDWFRLATSDVYAKEVRLYRLGRWILAGLQHSARLLDKTVGAVNTKAAVRSTLLGCVTLCGIGGLFLYLVSDVARGVVTPGDITLYISTTFGLHSSLDYLSGNVMYLRSTVDSMHLIMRFVSVSDYRPTPELEPVTEEAGLRFENVSFGYPDGREVLRDLSFFIPHGRSAAIVGPNGAGKTTLLKLVTRFYEPHKGRIVLNGKDIRQYDVDFLRGSSAVLFQDYCKYHASFAENIGYGRIESLHDPVSIERAARSGGAWPLANGYPDGLSTRLGKAFGGIDLSGGEWQKVALSRACMRNSAVLLLLDEPTAALDIVTEDEVYARFRELSAGRTTLLVSHRFSTVRMAQHILVLDCGRVIEEGDHQTLMARGGLYAEMYTLQAGGYQL